jgi:hypothetical protein
LDDSPTLAIVLADTSISFSSSSLFIFLLLYWNTLVVPHIFREISKSGSTKAAMKS